MFDIGPTELLLIVIVAVIVIGPKDLPLAMRTAGRWIGKVRKVSGHFRAGLDAMVREAEMEEMEKKWAEQNAKIMREHPNDGHAWQAWTEANARKAMASTGYYEDQEHEARADLGGAILSARILRDCITVIA